MNESRCRQAVAAAVVCVSLAAAQGPVWSEMRLDPPARVDSALAYDSGRDAVVLFGGAEVGGFGSDTWEFTAAGWRQVRTATTPPARAFHAMAFDPARGVVVMFGGRADSAGTMLGDTWEYDGVDWTMSSPASAPSPRAFHGMAQDGVNGGVLLFGGWRATAQETWRYTGSPPNWVRVATATTPPPQGPAHIAYDASRRRVVMFGQSSTLPYSPETWEYDGNDWQRGAVSPGPSQLGAPIAYDPVRGAIVTVCLDPSGFANETWVYDGTWQRRAPVTVPNSRYRHAISFHPATGVIVFGGYDGGYVLDETWTYASTGDNWTQRGPAPTPPVRESPNLVHDPIRGRLLMFGGWENVSVPSGDTWALDGSSWRRIDTPTPAPPLTWYAAAFDSRRARAVTFGGVSQSSGWMGTDETWEFDSARGDWSRRAPAHHPGTRIGYSMAYDARRGVVVLFGGQRQDGGWRALDDTWEYDGIDWRRVTTAHAPSPRMAYLTYDRRRGVVVLFGGMTIDLGRWAPVGETWEYDGVDWSRRLVANEPTPRAASLTYDADRGRVVMFGGYADGGGVYFVALDETWEYDGTNWSLVPTPLSPAARGSSGLAYDPTHGRTVLLFGRIDGGSMIADHWEYRGAQVPTWTRYGFGCAGSAGVPNLDASAGSVPALGATFSVELTNLLPVPGAFVLGMGTDVDQLAGLPLPLDLTPFGMAGCDLWVGVAPDLTVVGTHIGGARQLSFRLPADPRLRGHRIAMQAICFDARAANGCCALSNAGIATLH